MAKLADLMESRAAASGKMRGLLDTAEAETRDLTDAEDKQFKDLKAEVATLDKKLERQRDLDDAERRAPAVLHHGRGDGDFETRARDFSIVKAIRSAIGDDVDAGFERELSAEVRRRTGRTFRGIAVPDQVFEQRVMTVGDGSPASAGSLYPQVHRPDLFIDRLRSALVVGRLGATVLDGLVGENDIPKQTGSATAQWIDEEEALTPTDLSFEDVRLSPKTVGAVTSYSRRTLINAQPSIENIVRNDLAAVIASAIDHQAMVGDGSGNTPVGVINADGVTELNLNTPAWSQVLAFVSTIQGADADLGSLGWAMAPQAAAKLMGTNKVSGEPEHGFLMTEPGTLAGYPAAITTSLNGSGSPTVATAIFGAWSQLIVGYWSGVDILVNPYESAAYHRGRVLVRVMRDVDVAVRHGEAFAYADDMGL